MEVLILCGGKGTRIREVSESYPKPMLPIGERPILWHIMNHYSFHGFKKFHLCLGYKADVIKNYFINCNYLDHDFTIELKNSNIQIHDLEKSNDWIVSLRDTGLESMTGHRIKKLENVINGDTFMATYGDAVSTINLTKLLAFHKSHGQIATVTGVHPLGRFGELRLDGDRVSSFQEKPENRHDYINGGFFVFNRSVFDFIGPDEDEILEQGPMRALVEADELMVFRHDGFWQPMDTPREYEMLNNMVRRGVAPWLLCQEKERI